MVAPEKEVLVELHERLAEEVERQMVFRPLVNDPQGLEDLLGHPVLRSLLLRSTGHDLEPELPEHVVISRAKVGLGEPPLEDLQQFGPVPEGLEIARIFQARAKLD